MERPVHDLPERVAGVGAEVAGLALGRQEGVHRCAALGRRGVVDESARGAERGHDGGVSSARATTRAGLRASCGDVPVEREGRDLAELVVGEPVRAVAGVEGEHDRVGALGGDVGDVAGELARPGREARPGGGVGLEHVHPEQHVTRCDGDAVAPLVGLEVDRDGTAVVGVHGLGRERDARVQVRGAPDAEPVERAEHHVDQLEVRHGEVRPAHHREDVVGSAGSGFRDSHGPAWDLDHVSHLSFGGLRRAREAGRTNSEHEYSACNRRSDNCYLAQLLLSYHDRPDLLLK